MEVLQIQDSDMNVNMPVAENVEVPVVQKVSKIVEVPQVLYMDKVVDVQVLKQRQIPAAVGYGGSSGPAH